MILLILLLSGILQRISVATLKPGILAPYLQVENIIMVLLTFCKKASVAHCWYLFEDKASTRLVQGLVFLCIEQNGTEPRRYNIKHDQS